MASGIYKRNIEELMKRAATEKRDFCGGFSVNRDGIIMEFLWNRY